jgi:DNA-binding IclR family transcriptional regulator
MVADSGHSGTQSIERAVAILLFLATTPEEGARLSDVARTIGLNKATAHRVLSALVREGLAEKDPDTHLYQLGLQTLALNPEGGPRFAIRKLAAGTLDRLAAVSGDTAFLTVRIGFDALCLDRVNGTSLVQPHIMTVGSRWPLGVGAGSLALLASCPDTEIDAILACNEQAYARFGLNFTRQAVWSAVSRTRTHGHSFNDGLIVPGLAAVGVVMRDQKGAVIAALSIAGARDSLTPRRRDELAALLRREADALTPGLPARIVNRPDRNPADPTPPSSRQAAPGPRRPP